MSSANTISFKLPGFELDHVTECRDLVIQAHSTTLEATCPDCAQLSSRVHSYYTRSTDCQTTSLTARALASLVLLPPDELSEFQQGLIAQAGQLHPDIQLATQLAQEFATMLRQPAVAQLDSWIHAVQISPLPSLISFVSGLRQDCDAVRAAFMFPWSNGQVEGQINRLKVLKRLMYGRANFDLLRPRVLHPP